MLPINELFQTIQGEATFTGTPSVFVRLQGCDVGCPWCDTKHTWAVDPSRAISPAMMVAKEKDTASFARMEAHELASYIAGGYNAMHVVITGGEPCVHDLTELTAALHSAERRTQIETSGTQPILCDWRTWVTLSPKIGMPGGFKVRPDALERANEFKVPVGKEDDVIAFRDLMTQHGVKLRGRTVWLQPLSQSEKATRLCIEIATKRDWRVSIQTHKFLGVR